MLNSETGELIEKTLEHDGHEARKFYSTLPGQVPGGDRSYRVDALVLKLLEDLEIDCQVGHPSKVRAAEPRKQKHDRRDAALLLKLQGRKPLSIDLPTFDRAARSAHVADAPPLTQSPMPAKVDDSC